MYYARIVIEKAVNTLLTIDDGFDRFDEYKTYGILPIAEFRKLNANLEQ